MNMKPIMNKKGLFALVCALMGMTFSILTSCSDDLDVQQSYPFTVETMPVPKRIVKGETVEIRCELKREGRREVFRLYYTSECEDQQSIDIYFEDNSEPAQLFQLTFDFNNETEDEDTVVTSSGEELPVVVSQ